MEWQPIESAPRDGTRVLLWIEPTGIAMPFAWIDGRWMGDDFPLNMATPTDWRPMPEPPENTFKLWMESKHPTRQLEDRDAGERE